MTTATLLRPVSGNRTWPAGPRPRSSAATRPQAPDRCTPLSCAGGSTGANSTTYEPLADVRRPHVERYARDLEARGLARHQALRVSEACGADLCGLAVVNGHRVVRVVGKGDQPALIARAPRTSRAIDAAVGERTDGPPLARGDGSRLNRHAAGRIEPIRAEPARRLRSRVGGHVRSAAVRAMIIRSAETMAIRPGADARWSDEYG